MRIWSLHPRYFDAAGLVAVWREGLLAQAVLQGKTTGYRRHPQLDRFRRCPSPVGAMADYLRAVHTEATARGYRFDASKISRASAREPLTVTRSQLAHEWAHLLSKLLTRDSARHDRFVDLQRPQSHPLFRVVPGEIESWERVTKSTH
ncbi:MAG: hypothetical protein JW818_19795 [Pirellulales bacterium]|nr:hypothetical protein [Pirellulales bacterium]